MRLKGTGRQADSRTQCPRTTAAAAFSVNTAARAVPVLAAPHSKGCVRRVAGLDHDGAAGAEGCAAAGGRCRGAGCAACDIPSCGRPCGAARAAALGTASCRGLPFSAIRRGCGGRRRGRSLDRISGCPARRPGRAGRKSAALGLRAVRFAPRENAAPWGLSPSFQRCGVDGFESWGAALCLVFSRGAGRQHPARERALRCHKYQAPTGARR